jgi:hypothetical protein
MGLSLFRGRVAVRVGNTVRYMLIGAFGLTKYAHHLAFSGSVRSDGINTRFEV